MKEDSLHVVNELLGWECPCIPSCPTGRYLSPPLGRKSFPPRFHSRAPACFIFLQDLAIEAMFTPIPLSSIENILLCPMTQLWYLPMQAFLLAPISLRQTTLANMRAFYFSPLLIDGPMQVYFPDIVWEAGLSKTVFRQPWAIVS